MAKKVIHYKVNRIAGRVRMEIKKRIICYCSGSKCFQIRA